MPAMVDLDEVERRLEAGDSMDAIAAGLGVTPRTIRNRLHAAGRPLAESPRSVAHGEQVRRLGHVWPRLGLRSGDLCARLGHRSPRRLRPPGLTLAISCRHDARRHRGVRAGWRRGDGAARARRLVVLCGSQAFDVICRFDVIPAPSRLHVPATKFNDDGSGEWLELSPNNPALAGWSLADIVINTRAASDLAGATPMDRPEWIDTFPDSLTAIATLTNNSQRGTAGTWPTRPSLTRPGVDAINKRGPNPYGQILSWTYKNAFSEPTFRWDVFAYAGDPGIPGHAATIKGDFYGSPDGLYVPPRNRLWIQTDVAAGDLLGAAYTQFNDGKGFGNNMMLCADPITRVTRRFLVGPVNCEVTGVFVTPDERTMFLGIQHPGEAPGNLTNDPANPTQYSSWPPIVPGGRPRSALVMITKDDGGEIGS